MSELDANIIVDGQKVVATLAQSGDVIKDGGAIDATSVIQTDNGPQKVVKVMDINGGGGGGGTVDQTYDATSTNAQSGTAVAEAVAPALKNTATGTNSLTVLGTAASAKNATNIGVDSTGSQGSTSVGWKARCNNSGNSVAVGSYSLADYASSSIAIGNGANVEGTSMNPISYAIQIGEGTNSTRNTFQVYSYPMLDRTTGKIPMARLPIVQISQADYDALVAAGTVDANTLYLIV